MKKHQNITTLFKSYPLEHKSNWGKIDILFELYALYRQEYKTHVKGYWKAFIAGKIKNNKFSHLGSTKHIPTQLNASYLQICLSQSCSILNNYLSNIEMKFGEIIKNSSLADPEILHQLRTINKNHAWLNKESKYYPVVVKRK